MEIAIRHSGGPWQLRPRLVPEALDYSLAANGARRLNMSPTEHFRRQICAPFGFEGPDAPPSVGHPGAENRMFETEVPCPIRLDPRLSQQVRERLTDWMPAERRTLLSTNAARVYDILLD